MLKLRLICEQLCCQQGWGGVHLAKIKLGEGATSWDKDNTKGDIYKL